MVGRVTFQIEGLRELETALGKLPKATGKAALRRVAKKALQPFDQAWRERAPVLTGELEESGGVGTKLTRRQARLNRKIEGKASIEMHAGPNNPAAVPQEFGTFDQSAQPFMRPAWAATSGQVLDIVKSELGSEIERTAARAARRLARKGGRA